MAEHAEGHNIFLYMGQQEVPADVTHVIIDRSVKIVPRKAFQNCENLVSVESHNGVEVIKEYAFDGCESLREIKLTGVKEVGYYAFYNCASMTDVEFGNKLETIGSHAFDECTSLRKIKIPAVKCIHDHAFMYCEQLTDLELPGDLEIIEEYAFAFCPSLQRIAIPLKGNIIPFPAVSTWPSYRQQRYTQFHDCENLTTVDLVGVEGIHKTISSLLLESWRNEMNQEIDGINQVLPNTPAHEKTDAIRLWIRSILARIGYYKAEHNRLLKEHMIQLELAVWKAKLDDFRTHSVEAQPTKKAKIDVESMRNERRITSGADIIIKNVLPFLSLE